MVSSARAIGERASVEASVEARSASLMVAFGYWIGDSHRPPVHGTPLQQFDAVEHI
jgi:hypothetical protein